MIEQIQALNHILALGGIAGIIVVLIILADFLTKKKLSNVIRKWGMLFAFFTALGSSIMTLIYSEYFGIIPCGLCWIERIALYPQVILLGMAIYCKDSVMPRYGIGLSSIGLVVSLYHHYIQMGGSEFIKCPASGASDCAKRFFFEYDFMTFPLMSAILFGFLILLYLYLLKVRTN